MGRKFLIYRKVISRIHLLESIASFALIWAMIFSTPSYSSHNYTIQLDMSQFQSSNSTSLSPVYRLGALGYCTGSITNGNFDQTSCHNMNGLELDIKHLFKNDPEVPVPHLSRAHSVSELLYHGCLAAASFSLICIVLDIFNFAILRRMDYTPRKLKAYVSIYIASICSQIIVWTIMCAVSTTVINLVVDLANAYGDELAYTGIVVDVGVTALVLMRVSFSLGLMSSFLKSLLVISYFVKSRRNRNAVKETVVHSFKEEGVETSVDCSTVGDVFISGTR